MTGNTLDYQDLLKNLKSISFVRNPPRFISHLSLSGGMLPDLPGAHACWYFCRCAIQMRKKVADGADYEGETDHQAMYNNLARSVAALYKLDSPADFLKFMGVVKMEAMMHELEWYDDIMNPLYTRYVTKDNS